MQWGCVSRSEYYCINFPEEGDFHGLPFDLDEPTEKIGTKKMRKLEMKAEKKALREVCAWKNVK